MRFARDSSLSAVVTDGRCAPTSLPIMSCVSRTGTTTPSRVTCPQRSARCHSSACTRASTRGIELIVSRIASQRERRSVRAISFATSSG